MRSISPFGLSRHFAWAQQSGRFWREADINRRAEPAGLVANDPKATFGRVTKFDIFIRAKRAMG
jgi:hypothetical protein